MRQQRLMLGLSIVLLMLTGFRMTLPGATQSLPFSSVTEKEELAEAKQLNQQVVQLYNQGRYEDAIPLAKRAVDIREKVQGKNHPDVATSLNNLALLYVSQGKYTEAERLYQRSLAINEKILGKDHLAVADSLNNLADLYRNQNKYIQAETLHQRSLAIREKKLGKDHLDVAQSLNNLAEVYRDQGKYTQAELLLQNSLTIREKKLGQNHQDVANSLNNLAALYVNQGKYAKAEPLYQRSLRILEKSLGEHHLTIAITLGNFAILYKNQRKYEQAEPLLQRSLAILEKALGKDHLYVATGLNNLAALYDSQGKYVRAESLYKTSLSILERALGKDHLNIAASLNNLATLYGNQGKYEQAELLLQRSLSIREKVLGENHPDVAASLNNLAESYRNQGENKQAELLLQRSLSIREKVLGEDHPETAQSLNNLAALYVGQGKYVQAELIFQRSLAIRKKNLGGDNLDVAQSLNNLADLYIRQEKYMKAELLFQRSLDINKKKLGENHPETANSLNNLALTYANQEKYPQAELLFQKALSIRENVLEKDHPDVANTLNNLAELYRKQRQYAKAEPVYQRALDINEKKLGKNHPYVGINLNNLAVLYASQEKNVQAVEFHRRSSIIKERELSQILLNSSEQDKKNYIDNIAINPSFSAYLAISSNHPNAKKLAMTNLLRSQGRILDSTAETIQSIRTQLRNRPDLQKLFDSLKLVFQQQSALTTSKLSREKPQAYGEIYQELEQRRQEIESKLSSQSAVFRQVIAPVELAKVQALVPQNAALVHIVRYQPFNPKGDKPKPHYAAAILRSTGDPHWVDLGTAAEIEQNIQKFRSYLQDGSNTNNQQRQQIARTLHTQLIQPLRQHLGDAKHLLLSPDAALNLIPFEALQDTDNKYLIEQYTFSYLTSGRDLLRFPAAPPSRQAPIVFSEIHYQANFSPLATQAETNQIQKIFPNTQIIRDRAATKTALQQVQAPQILHLATHGFFKPAPKDTNNLDNPLTRSGIVLAGADSRSGAGILTGLEVSGLDLYGTQLVVLSACETGLGDISAGEGIYGLRRALVIAGSQSQVLSLWKVGDAATVELMKLFYQNLKAGMGRHEALRDAQLKLLRHPNYQNPYNWAAFIPSGNWEPLPK
jgi:CHAT domain-containing protein